MPRAAARTQPAGAVRITRATIIGLHSAVAHFVASASTMTTAASKSQTSLVRLRAARTASHDARAMRQIAIGSYVAHAPKSAVGPTAANIAAPNRPALRPNSREAVAYNNAVAPSMKTSDSSR